MEFAFLALSVLFQHVPTREFRNSIGMKFASLPPGTFLMGSPKGPGVDKDENQFLVTITTRVNIGVYEVTQAEYEQIMGENPSYYWFPKGKSNEGIRRPVEMVRWHEATEFCEKLSALPDEVKAGRTYRLPTEAEWEYACRAGSKTTYFFGDSPRQLKDFAWFEKNSKIRSHDVGGKKPNGFGLYDMYGNVGEWCLDWRAPYPSTVAVDPAGPTSGLSKIVRGGGMGSLEDDCRSALRRSLIFGPRGVDQQVGFRIVCEIRAVKSELNSKKSY